MKKYYETTLRFCMDHEIPEEELDEALEKAICIVASSAEIGEYVELDEADY